MHWALVFQIVLPLACKATMGSIPHLKAHAAILNRKDTTQLERDSQQSSVS